MLKTYLMTAWRLMKKQKLFALINVTGLAVGLAAFMLIAMYVVHELNYDQYHPKIDQMYLVTNPEFGFGPSAITSAPIGPMLKARFPEVELYTRLRHYGEFALLANKKRSRLEPSLYWADPSVMEMFLLHLREGDAARILREPYGLLVSESAAARYFGDEPPLGKILYFEDIYVGKHEFQVTGVYADMPANAHFRMDVIAPFKTYAEMRGRDLTNWGYSGYYTYVRLNPDVNVKMMAKKMNLAIHELTKNKSTYSLLPVSDIHLRTADYDFRLSSQGNLNTVVLFAAIAILILIIACINYMNLASARALHRSKEMGLRKVIGAKRSQLIQQQLGESLLTTFLAGALSLAMVALLLPDFGRLMDRTLSFERLLSPAVFLAVVLLWIVVGFVAGAYAAFRMTRFPAVDIFRFSAPCSTGKDSWIKNGLVVFQFVISIAMIIGALVIHQQLQFIKNTDMGFEKEHIAVVRVRDGEARRQWKQVKAAMLRLPGVLSVSGAQHLPNDNNSWEGARWPGQGENERTLICQNVTDHDFIDLFGIQIIAGRNFDEGEGTAYLLNESAVESMGWEEPLGRMFGRSGREGPVIGIIGDYHLRPLHEAIQPMYIRLNTDRTYHYLCVKLSATDLQKSLQGLKEIMQRFAPLYPFEYVSMASSIESAYETEIKLGLMIELFAMLAIVISCLGLLGLTSYEVERRVKEIGIRKVLGASVFHISSRMVVSLIRWGMVAAVLAVPLALWGMHRWLSNFAYHFKIGWQIPLQALGLVVSVSAGVTLFQSVKAALADPVKSLKHE